MSKRVVHLCDTPECENKYYKTCPICDVEKCTDHFGVNPIILQVIVAEPRKILAGVNVMVCHVCNMHLGRGAPVVLIEELIKPAGDRLTEALRAMLAGAALSAVPK